MTILLLFQADNIWVPIVDFLNTRNNKRTLVDDDCKITIKRLGPPLKDTIERSKEGKCPLSSVIDRVISYHIIYFHTNFKVERH